jgi:tRNA-Thr(GGU) m(6)t(6)A37 methyltransferase TsaA
MKDHCCPVIGVIRTPYATKEECPIQPRYSGDAVGRVEVFPEYAQALKDIDGFSHLYLVYQFDRAGEVVLVRPTFLDPTPHGIFASRHPCRPSGIGFSIVKLAGRDGGVLAVEGVDMLDNTPLLDIKPYMPQFDAFPEAARGWTEDTDKTFQVKPAGRE